MAALGDSNSMVIGVDGGGTHTRAAIVSIEGAVLGYGEAGPSNCFEESRETVARRLEQALASAWRSSGLIARPAAAAYFGIAGVNRDWIRSIALALETAQPNAVHVDNDLKIALAGALANRPGLVVVSGTGSACYGRDPAGQEWRAGGWGSFVCDMGGAFELCRRAVQAILRAYDGRGRPTAMRARFLSALGVDHERHMLAALRRKKETYGNAALSDMAHLVTGAAGAGDRVALELAQATADALAAMVRAVLAKLEFAGGAPEVAAVGGLLSHTPILATMLAERLGEGAGAPRLVEAELAPVFGAALLALEKADGGNLGARVARMRQTAGARLQPRTPLAAGVAGALEKT